MENVIGRIEALTDAALGRPLASLPPVPTSWRADLSAQLDTIAANADIDQLPEPVGTLLPLKRLVLRAGAFNWVRQRAVNRALEQSVQLLARELEWTRSCLERTLQQQGGMISDLSASVDVLIAESEPVARHSPE